MRGHPDGCTCGGCRQRLPFVDWASEWKPGPSWPHETLTWLAGERGSSPKWLSNQVRKAATVLDDLPPEMVKQMCHRTNMREAANDRGTDRPA